MTHATPTASRMSHARLLTDFLPMRLSLPLLYLLVPTLLGAQDASVTCADRLRAFRAKLEANYAGMKLEISGARAAEHERLFGDLRDEAGRTEGEGCFFVLDRYVKWFRDPHLFVFQSTRLDTAETARRASLVRRGPIDETAARATLARRAANLDPIEGIWNDGEGLRVAVLQAPDSPDRFTATVITSDTVAWPVGAERAVMRRLGAGRYLVDLQSRNFSLRHLDGVIHKEVILRLSPGIWAKEYPTPEMQGLVDVRQPRRPTLVVRGRTVIVSMVSHDGPYRRVLDSLVRAHAADLHNAERLIVDLRGNEGGGALTSAALTPYVRSRDRRADRYVSDTSWMLSSPDQLTYVRRAFGSDTTRFVRTIVERMTASPGALVPMPAYSSDPADTLVAGPARVAVLVDGGTVSAAEVLVLQALRSTRARVFGQPTAGALDYQSTNVVRVLPTEARWLLGYGTITASSALPRNGMRGTGILPDVTIPVDGLWEAILDVERQLGGRTLP
jgi:hypothetical protein